MGDDDPLRVFYDAAAEGLHTFGCDPLRGTRLKEMLDRASFANIRCVSKRMPISTWAPDSQLKTLGLFMMAVMHDSLDALAAKPLAALGISAADRRELTKAREGESRGPELAPLYQLLLLLRTEEWAVRVGLRVVPLMQLCL